MPLTARPATSRPPTPRSANPPDHRPRRGVPRALAVARALSLWTALLAAPAALRPALAAPPPSFEGVQLVDAWPDVEFKEPIFVVHAGDATDWLYVGEQGGRVQRIAKYRGTGPVGRPTLYLDIASLCYARSQGGLLGMAFHPEFRTNRLAYVSYLAERPGAPDGRVFALRIVEYRDVGDRLDPGSARVVLEVPKKTAQHQGGWIAFGPDRMLYVGTGDGNEGKDDPQRNAQDALNLLGKILRIDPLGGSGGRGYGIPSGNPWPSSPGQVHPAIWAYGFRNPWRFSWDPAGRMLTTEPGTTGPESREWVTVVERAGNHGWPFYEGTRVLVAPPAGQTFVPRAFEYVRGPGDAGTAGVGGHVYRGDRIKALKGKYVFGDYMRGEVYCIDLVDGPQGRPQGRNWRKVGECPDMASIGEDAQGELYFCSNGDLGVVFTLAPTG